MAELKTKATKASVAKFIKSVDAKRRDDCQTIVDIMTKATHAEPQMWGKSIVGFGRFKYKYGSGREAEWMLTGFSPRKSDLTLYIMPSVQPFPTLLKRLGKYKTGKSCLYIKKLADVDVNVLEELVTESVEKMATLRVGK